MRHVSWFSGIWENSSQYSRDIPLRILAKSLLRFREESKNLVHWCWGYSSQYSRESLHEFWRNPSWDPVKIPRRILREYSSRILRESLSGIWVNHSQDSGRMSFRIVRVNISQYPMGISLSILKKFLIFWEILSHSSGVFFLKILGEFL